MLPPPGGDVEPVDAGASGSMPVCTASNWLDKTAPSVTLTRVASTQSPSVKLTSSAPQRPRNLQPPLQSPGIVPIEPVLVLDLGELGDIVLRELPDGCRGGAPDTKTSRSEHADVLQGRPEADQSGTQEIHEAVTAQVLGGVRNLKPATTAHDEARLEMALAQDRGMINGRRTPARRDRNIQKRSHVLVVLSTIDVKPNVRRKDVAPPEEDPRGTE